MTATLSCDRAHVRTRRLVTTAASLPLTAADRYIEYAGTFRLVRKIAVGGMATVYEAEQLGPAGFAKRIALKVIHPQYAKQKEWLQLFIDEAKLSANLMHGNIVQIYQLGEVRGRVLHRHGVHPGPDAAPGDRPPLGARAADSAAAGGLRREPRLPRARLRPQLRRARTSGASTSCTAMSHPATSWRRGTGTSSWPTSGSPRRARRSTRPPDASS